jgi:hypothetical protein
LPTIDPSMATLIAHIMSSNQQNAQAMQMLAMSSNLRGPRVPFPTWDGSKVNLPLFLAQIESYKSDPFFASVTNWTVTLLGQEIYSKRLYANMMAKLPTKKLHQFLGDSKCSTHSTHIWIRLIPRTDSRTPSTSPAWP